MVNGIGDGVTAAYTKTDTAWNDIKDNWSSSQIVTYSFVGAGKSDLTYYPPGFFSGTTKNFSSVISRNYVEVVKKAFAEWSSYANIEFLGVADSNAHVGRSAYADIRLSTAYIDGSSQYGSDTYAQTFFPDNSNYRGGDMVFDSANSSLWDYDSFYRVVLHEIGHAIGLAHSTSRSSVMYGEYSSGKNHLTRDDWQGAKSIYGAQDDAPIVYTLASSEKNIHLVSGISNLIIKGNSLSNEILGSAEAEVIHGGNGDDTLKGNSGNDYLYGEERNDSLSGGSGDDLLDGGSASDTLRGDDGNDSLYGSWGADQLFGGLGKDRLDGGTGNDSLNGDGGNDTLLGGVGKDTLLGGSDHDYLVGNDSLDFLYGENGTDRLYGGGSDDHIYGGNHNDTLYGNVGDDFLYGGAGDDILKGGSQNDNLFGNSGDDSLYGNNGNDTLVGGSGADYLDGGRGTDTADYSAVSSGISANLNSGSSNGYPGDKLINIENIIGTRYDDILFGSSKNNTLFGGNGSDTVVASGGDDTLSGGGGDDTLFGNSGDDSVDGGANDDMLYGGSGNDTLIGGAGSNVLDGGNGYDVAKFSGIETDYTVAVTAENMTVTNKATGDVDALYNIEELAYTLGNVSSMIRVDENTDVGTATIAKIVRLDSLPDISTVFEQLQSDIDDGKEIIDLDTLFDELGIGGPEARADLVEIATGDDSAILVIDHETVSEYSLSLVDLELGDHSAGFLSVSDLMTSGIDVGDES